jgi:hypothetical protein
MLACSHLELIVESYRRVISPVARPLPTQGNINTVEMQTDTRASRGIRTHVPSVPALFAKFSV